MIRHEWFGLWLHTDKELSTYLGSTVIERETLHEWPLSCVQHIVTANGHRYIYKTQSAPTVEDKFYAAAKSDILIGGRSLSHDPLILLLDFIDAPTLSEMPQSDAVQLVRKVLAGIQQIQGNPPVWLDISSAEKWHLVMSETLSRLKTLVSGGEFTRVNDNAIRVFERCIAMAEVLDVAEKDGGLVHGDLYRENVFLLADGSLKVIDWARPYWGATAIDEFTLLESLGCAAPTHTPITIMSICLRIHWLVECASRWFPTGIAAYDEQIAGFIEKLTR